MHHSLARILKNRKGLDLAWQAKSVRSNKRQLKLGTGSRSSEFLNPGENQNATGTNGPTESHIKSAASSSNQSPASDRSNQAAKTDGARASTNSVRGQAAKTAAGKAGARSLRRLRFTWCKAGSSPSGRAEGPDLHQASPRRRRRGGDDRSRFVVEAEGGGLWEEGGACYLRRLVAAWKGRGGGARVL